LPQAILGEKLEKPFSDKGFFLPRGHEYPMPLGFSLANHIPSCQTILLLFSIPLPK
jgi:hypothetical protein